MSAATDARNGRRNGSDPVKRRRSRELWPSFKPGYRLDEQRDKDNAEDAVTGGG